MAAPLAAGLLVGCAAGPDFKRPAPPEVADYTRAPVTATVAAPGTPAGEPQRLDRGADLQGDWWTLFRSKPLTDLVAEALAHNHDRKAAEASLLAARETTRAQRGAYFPTVTAGFAATRQRTSGALAPTPSTNASEYSLFTPEVDVSYAPDVFGLNRRSVEQAKAEEEASRYQLIATDLTIATNVANAVIQDAALQEQIAATRELVESQTKLLEAIKLQVSKGYSSGLDLAAQQSQLALTQASLPPLLKQEAQERDLIAVLVGRYPSQAPGDAFRLSNLTLPRDLPLSLPSTLVQQRPDVLQAQENMHAASAAIGIATAQRLPNIQLTANAGTSALAIGQLFNSGTSFWTLGAAATQTLFDGGQLKHKERAAKALYVQASEQYRSTVLNAFQNVADTLVALDQDAQALKANADAADAAKVTLGLSERQYKDGYASYLSLLGAQQAYLQARISLIQAQAARFSDTVALYQALGGGWWNRADLAKDDHGR